MFKLKFKFGGAAISSLKGSAAVQFVISDNKTNLSLDETLKKFNAELSDLQKKNFISDEGDQLRVYGKGSLADLLIIKKIKLTDGFTNDFFRDYFAGMLSSLKDENLANLQISLPSFEFFKDFFKSEEYLFQSVIEGICLGNYSFEKYKSDKKKEKSLTVNLYGDKKNLGKAISEAQAVIDGVLLARDLANEPSSVLYPSELAKRAKKNLSAEGIKVKIFDENEIQKKNLGGVIAVGKGSDNPPRFIIFHYKPAKHKKKVILVGKGVTFDSGGISIKPSAGMSEMKADMSGAAAVIGTMLSAARAALEVEIIGVIPAVENMPSGKSMKPGDIVMTSSGKSIEVDNTDAEGRIILADALEYASKEKPDAIIDLATLTGACVVALGEYTAGIFTKDDKLADDLYKAGQVTFERLWRLPLWDDYKKLIKSDVADVKNVGGKWGGAITAAKFLEYFVDKNIPWAHLDIAGPAMPSNLNSYTQKYMTGFGVRVLFEYLSALK
ncbi:MAG: leucyl aminopeptidase [Bacteroidota bacterium]|nr:leucyl aminopeptidase [Bacteroidota bacterium]MDP4191616.1 leucyl aminopeptidase [Bacteroidota bacterium]MDP4193851.1 leucyl aminopeptidase [Bacteroidota bacterium]